MLYASPSDSWAAIQGMLALDDVTLNAGTGYPGGTIVGANSGAGIVVPPGRTLVANGATIDVRSVANSTADTDATTAILLSAGSKLIGGTVTGPESRALQGARANHGHKLLYVDNGASFATSLDILVDGTVFMHGPNQAIALNNARGVTLRDVQTPAPLVPPTCTSIYLGHYIDLDVTAKSRVTRDIIIEGGDFDSFGHECLKLENVQDIVARRSPRTGKLPVFRNYVTIVQDADDPNGSLSGVVLEGEFHQHIILANLKRRWNGSAADNLGAGTVTIRGRFVGNGMIYGGPTSSTIAAGYPGADATARQAAADADQFAGLTADRCSFEGKNSHAVSGISGTAWMTRCSGIKTPLTLYVRNAGNPKLPFEINPPINPEAVGDAGAGNTVSAVTSSALTATTVANFGLAARGVVVDLPEGTLSGAQNVGTSFSTNVNVPITWQADGKGVTLDGAGSTSSGFSITGTNTAKQTFDNITSDGFAGGTSTRGWTINSAVANVELYRVRSRNCSNTSGGGGAGRAQAYASLYLGPGVLGEDCSTGGNGGCFLIDSSGTSVCVLEGPRALRGSAANGGGFRINSPYAQFRALEAVDCVASAGPGGMAISWTGVVATQTVQHYSGRGNVGSAGVGNDIQIFVGATNAKVILRRSALGSGGLVVSKTGSGNLDRGELGRDTGTTFSELGGTNADLGGDVVGPLGFEADTSSVVLAWDSPLRGAANVAWTVGTDRPFLDHGGSWMQVNASNKTNIGARA